MNEKIKVEGQTAELERLREQNRRLVGLVAGLLQDGKVPPEAAAVACLCGEEDRLAALVRRLGERLDSGELTAEVAQELLAETACDAVALMAQGRAPRREWVAVQWAVRAPVDDLPVPFVLGTRSRAELRRSFDALASGARCECESWPEPQELHPGFSAQTAVILPLCLSDGEVWLLAMFWKDWLASPPPAELQFLESVGRYVEVLLEQEQWMDEIRELRDQNESLIASMPSAIIGLDFLGTVTFWNERAERLFSLHGDEAIGQPLGTLVPAFGPLTEELVRMLQSGDEDRLLDPVVFHNAQGGVRQLQPHFFHLLGSGRGELALRIDDVSRQVEWNRRSSQALKMETVGALAGGIAKEFNTLLGSVVGRGMAMYRRWQEQGLANTEDLADLGELVCTSQQAADLARRLHTLARRKGDEMRAMDLRVLLHNVKALCESSFGSKIHVQVQTSAPVAWIHGNTSQLENVLLNLCLNARDAMPNGGDLTLALEGPLAGGEGLLGRAGLSSSGQRYWRVLVRDTGEGMTSEVKARLFEPFFTTRGKERGTGLGMTIVEQGLALHHALLDLDTAEGAGTTFQLYFPELEGEQPVAVADAACCCAKEQPQVLIVDPTGALSELGHHVLAPCGFGVQVAHDGSEALRVQKNGCFNLVVFDLDGQGEGALPLYRELLSQKPGQAVLFVSACLDQWDFAPIRSVGPFAVIEKPITPDHFQAVVRSLVP